MGDEAGHSGFGQGRGGNEGFSGTPLWKIKDQMAAYREQAMQTAMAAISSDQPPEAPNVLVDAVVLGGPPPGGDGKHKPLVRHVLVKDLNKVAARAKIELPKVGVFKDRAPMGLYCLFDGQSCASQPPDPSAAEFCARNFHTKLLANLASLPPDGSSPAFVKAALIKTFEDLDTDLLAVQPAVAGGCGAAVALLVGEILFTGVLGRCGILGATAAGTPTAGAAASGDDELKVVPLGNGQVALAEPEEMLRLKRAGAMLVGTGPAMTVRHPKEGLSSVTRSLGDRTWKGAAGGQPGPALVLCTPDVHSMPMTSEESSSSASFALLLGSAVTSALRVAQVVDVVRDYQHQPRGACGEIAERALAAHSQGDGAPAAPPPPMCTVVQACVLPRTSDSDRKKQEGAAPAQPPAKKPKTGAAIGKDGRQSVRLRHILVRYTSAEKGAVKQVDAKNKPITRTRQEAESMLRKAIKELRQDLRVSKKKPRDPMELITMQAAKFSSLCREMSDCTTAQKGGTTCGDLGWMLPAALAQIGGNFRENVEVLRVGQWSDITSSDQGLHLIQRIA